MKKEQIINRFQKFLVRLKCCYIILFRKYNHWVILNLDKENLIKLLTDKEFEVSMMYHGLQKWCIYKMIKKLSNTKNDIDMILEKAEFEAKSDEFSKHLNNN